MKANADHTPRTYDAEAGLPHNARVDGYIGTSASTGFSNIRMGVLDL